MESRPAKNMSDEIERLLNWCTLRSTELHERDSGRRAAKMVNLKSDLLKQKRTYEEADASFDVEEELEGLIEWTDMVLQQRVAEDELPQLELARIADFGQHLRARLMNYRNS